MTDAHRRVAVAERAARAGGAVARQSFRGELRVDTKVDKTDLVTEADEDAQRQVITTLREEFPGDAIVGEEEAVPRGADEAVDVRSAVPETGDTWVIDPIDGTSNYARGLKLWTTAVAAVVDREVVAAATYFPATEDMYAAGAEGATRNGGSLSVSDRTDPETFLVSPVGRYRADRADVLGTANTAAAERLGDVRRFGSMQATLAFVASGELDAAFAVGSQHPWDAMGGIHLVRQAGGRVTDIDGERWTPDSDGFVVTNGEAHDAVREAAERARDAGAE